MAKVAKGTEAMHTQGLKALWRIPLHYLKSCAGPILLIVAWELATRTGVIQSVLLPGPAAVFNALLSAWRKGILLPDIEASVQRVAIGFAIGSGAGFVLGIAFLDKRVRLLLNPVIELIRPIPPLAWIPLALLWFGFGNPPAYFLVSLGSFFPVMTNTQLGFSRVETAYISTATVLGLSRWDTLGRVILPQAAPAILSGLKTAIGVSWMIVVTAELVGAQSGLGYMIQISRAQLQTDLVIGGMVVIGIIGYLLTALVTAIERILVPWRFRGRELAAK